MTWQCRARQAASHSAIMLLALLAAVMTPVGVQSGDLVKPIGKDLQPLQGVWKFEMCTTDWWPHRTTEAPSEQPKWRWSVKGNEISWTGLSTGDVRLSFTVDPARSPSQIDLIFLDGPHKGTKIRGIYKLSPGDTCQFCLADPGDKVERPKTFSFESYEGRSLIIVERANR